MREQEFKKGDKTCDEHGETRTLGEKKNININIYIVKEIHTGCGVKLPLQYHCSPPHVNWQKKI